MPDFGIDISHHNTVSDWKAVRADNITFVSAKLTEAVHHVDDMAGRHVDGARAAGLNAGGYHFARPGDVAGQVASFTAQLKAHGLLGAASMAPMLDMEAPELRAGANAFVADFVPRLRAATGVRRVLIYANLDWYATVLRPAEWVDADVLLWIARFNGDPGNTGFSHPNLALHQHTANGRVSGIPGDVDRNVTVGGHTRAGLLVGGAAPAVHVVVAGETLSRIARENRTTVAALVRINHIPDPDVIRVGQVLALV